MQPLDPYPGGAKPWHSRCLDCGEISSPRLTNITSGQGGCTPCAATANGLASRKPETLAIAQARGAGFNPLEPYPGGNKPWLCRCLNCDEIVTPRLSNILRPESDGCQNCANNRPDLVGPAVLYLITHPELGAHKVGVTGQGSTRVASFKNVGWHVFELLAMVTGRQAYAIETAVLNRLREQGVALGFVPKDKMRNGGFTETFSAASISLTDAFRLVLAETRAYQRRADEMIKMHLTTEALAPAPAAALAS
ncbi:hypothetical protein ABT369_26750 [Dactylosporangium sp. NPDC000244]|uniref:hypothetical protein n=1 Tax=Dactylosporangium sp. NPDC000244 TaxID=3154365 RepID=UPI00332D593A